MTNPAFEIETKVVHRETTMARPIEARRVVLALLLLGLSLWVVWHFLPALVWATVLALATWPLFERLRRALGEERPSTAAALIMTLGVGLVLIVPLAFLGFEAGHEARRLIPIIEAAEHNGLPVPPWTQNLPYVGESLAAWWQENLADPGSLPELLGRFDAGVVVGWARSLGTQLLRRMTILAFTLLALFFVFRDGEGFARESESLIGRLFGPEGQRVGHNMIGAVRGTVNGLVLVGLGEGAVLGIAYLALGLPHPALLGAATGILATIPLGAPLVFGGASAYLLAGGRPAAGAGLFAFGLLVVGVADHILRPFLIGNAARLSFLWVLLGIFGGLEAFGLVGLFTGPAVMAASVALWREWVELAPRGALP